MVDLLGITCDGGGSDGGVDVVVVICRVLLMSTSCCSLRSKSSTSASTSTTLSKSCLNDIYCTSRLNGGETSIGSIKLVLTSNESAGNPSPNSSRNNVFWSGECNGSAESDANKV